MTYLFLLGLFTRFSTTLKHGHMLGISAQTQDPSLGITHPNLIETLSTLIIIVGGIMWIITGSGRCPSPGVDTVYLLSLPVKKHHDQKHLEEGSLLPFHFPIRSYHEWKSGQEVKTRTSRPEPKQVPWSKATYWLALLDSLSQLILYIQPWPPAQGHQSLIEILHRLTSDYSSMCQVDKIQLAHTDTHLLVDGEHGPLLTDPNMLSWLLAHGIHHIHPQSSSFLSRLRLIRVTW